MIETTTAPRRERPCVLCGVERATHDDSVCSFGWTPAAPTRLVPVAVSGDALADAESDAISDRESEQVARRQYEADLFGTARGQFQLLWDSINGQRGYGWESNPWCWCVSFRRVRP